MLESMNLKGMICWLSLGGCLCYERCCERNKSLWLKWDSNSRFCHFGSNIITIRPLNATRMYASGSLPFFHLDMTSDVARK